LRAGVCVSLVGVPVPEANDRALRNASNRDLFTQEIVSLQKGLTRYYLMMHTQYSVLSPASHTEISFRSPGSIKLQKSFPGPHEQAKTKEANGPRSVGGSPRMKHPKGENTID